MVLGAEMQSGGIVIFYRFLFPRGTKFSSHHLVMFTTTMGRATMRCGGVGGAMGRASMGRRAMGSTMRWATMCCRMGVSCGGSTMGAAIVARAYF